jgi:hypothetical protein
MLLTITDTLEGTDSVDVASKLLEHPIDPILPNPSAALAFESKLHGVVRDDHGRDIPELVRVLVADGSSAMLGRM